jgi:hypothetical protein
MSGNALIGRFRSAAAKAGKQATAFGIEVGAKINEGSDKLSQGLKLESEVSGSHSRNPVARSEAARWK